MALSRQFKSLGKISGFFAAAFGVAGVALGVMSGDGLLSAIATHAIAYGALGGMSGASTALLLARSEAGRRIEEVPTWRVTAWGVVGGAAPAAMFAVLGLGFGGSAAALVPLLGLGVVGAGLGGMISASASAATKHSALKDGDADRQLPAG